MSFSAFDIALGGFSAPVDASRIGTHGFFQFEVEGDGMNYITTASITDAHLKRFESSYLQVYVTEANEEYEDLANKLGVSDDLIVTPIPNIAKRYLKNFVTMRIAEDNIGVNNVVTGEEDMYRLKCDRAKTKMESLEKQITPELIMGTAGTNRKSWAINTSRLYRG